MKGLYRFYEDCGRMGHLDGLFVADSKQVAAIQNQNVYFGEVLGKHSEITVKIGPENIKLVTDNQQFLADCETYIGTIDSGHNPFDRWEPETDEEEE